MRKNATAGSREIGGFWHKPLRGFAGGRGDSVNGVLKFELEWLKILSAVFCVICDSCQQGPFAYMLVAALLYICETGCFGA